MAQTEGPTKNFKRVDDEMMEDGMGRPKLNPRLARFVDMDKFLLVNEILQLEDEVAELKRQLAQANSMETAADVNEAAANQGQSVGTDRRPDKKF